jgi:hypothetical protein
VVDNDMRGGPQPALTTTSIPPANSCNIYDGARNYRLGDVTGSRWFRHTPGGASFHLREFPRSLASQFLRTFGHGTPAYRAYYNSSCWSHCVKVGYCQCYVPRAHALHQLLDKERSASSAANNGTTVTTSSNVLRALAHTAAVHLRVGDVVDQSPFALDEMLRLPTKFSTRCGAQKTREGCLSISPIVYVQPLSRYQRVVDTFRALRIRRVVLVAASSSTYGAASNSTSFVKSCEYVRRMGLFFEREGFATSFRLGQHPDEDFRFFTRVACMVPSLSGFGLLAGQVAQKFGVHVLMPEGLTLPTFDLTG